MYVQLPAEGKKLKLGKSFAKMESGKWLGKVPAPVNGVLEEINEDDGAISLDDALDAFKAEDETGITADTLGDFDSLDLEEEIGLDEEAEDDTAGMLEDDDKGMNDLLDELDLDEQSDEADVDLDSTEDLDELLGDMDLEEEATVEPMQTEPVAEEGPIKEELEGLEDLALSDISSGASEEGDVEGLVSDDTNSLDETLTDANLWAEIVLVDQEDASIADASRP